MIYPKGFPSYPPSPLSRGLPEEELLDGAGSAGAAETEGAAGAGGAAETTGAADDEEPPPLFDGSELYAGSA